MRVLILADELFAAHENSLLARLEIGLADEGVRVVHAVPASAASLAPAPMIADSAVYKDVGLPVSRPLRARTLLNSVTGTEHGGSIDIIHAFGGASWLMAVEMCTQIGAALVIEVWRAGLGARAAALRDTITGPEAVPLVLLSPDPVIERLLHAEGPGLTVRSAPWGVHCPDEPRQILQPDRAVAAMMVGGGRDSAAFSAAFHGLAQAIRAHPQLMVFVDARAARRANLWPIARKLDVLDHLSLIEDLEGRRDLVLEGDFLIRPETSGEQRSIDLEAMAVGMIVIAGADPLVSSLIEGRTARLVQTGRGLDTGADAAARWGEVILWAMEQPAAARHLAESARQFVRSERLASSYVRAVLDAYALVGTRGTLPFPSAPSR